jgi:hypothetical protein
VHGVSTEVTENISRIALPRCAPVPAVLHQDRCPLHRRRVSYLGLMKVGPDGGGGGEAEVLATKVDGVPGGET